MDSQYSPISMMAWEECCISSRIPLTNAGCPICPDFLRRLLALIHSMRLSLMKGAHADLSSTAWQEIGVKPYFGLSGITALNVPLSAVGSTTAMKDLRPPWPLFHLPHLHCRGSACA